MARRRDGWRTALGDLAGGLFPLSVWKLHRELAERLKKIPNTVNEYGYDPYGMSPEWVRKMALPGALLYRRYFRVETFDIDRLPPGRVLVIANHAGQLPFDGAMLAAALLLDADPPRIVRPMGEYWLPNLPGLSIAMTRGGTLVGTPENCIHMLQNEECVMVFPEGVRGMNKRFSERYRLQRFGLGFMRLALRTGTPIVPVAIVGSEEQQPGFGNLPSVARVLGMPAFPLTLGFPWLGPLGILPLPVKYRIHFGEPVTFEGAPHEEDADLEVKVDQVKRSISVMLERGRRARAGIFI